MVDYIIHNIKITFIVLLTIAIIFGNCLVIISVIFSEKLRRSCSQLTVRLITSLAVADLLVGICVLPFSIGVQLNNGYWFFGKALCQLWLAIDVWLCTASIYNLLAISLDRFIAITEPLRYAALMTPHRGTRNNKNSKDFMQIFKQFKFTTFPNFITDPSNPHSYTN